MEIVLFRHLCFQLLIAGWSSSRLRGMFHGRTIDSSLCPRHNQQIRKIDDNPLLPSLGQQAFCCQIMLRAVFHKPWTACVICFQPLAFNSIVLLVSQRSCCGYLVCQEKATPSILGAKCLIGRSQSSAFAAQRKVNFKKELPTLLVCSMFN